jgi:malto-oligosyltrehalose synthase
MNNRMIDLVSTYRIQFHSGFTFAHLEQVLPYLHQLGVKTMYASPIFKSVPGSNHGYNVTDPLQVNPELGTLEQLRAISTRMKSLGMNWLQDIVPNHMAYHPCNHWLMDVLEKGPSSRYASYFDVTLRNTEKLMAPFLSDTLEQVVERKEVQLVYTEKGLAFRCGDLLFPVQLESYLALLQGANGALDALKDEISNNDVDGLKLGLCVLLRDPVLQAYLDTQLERTNNSPQALIQLAAQQHYELCHWRETEKRINYRRFFIINEMICLNMQHEEVFDHYHQLVKQLVDEDVFQGVRVDHIDGLSDPSQYLERLRALVGEQVYIAVEKILEPGERLPAYWPVQGTTGYDFLATVNNAFTNRKGKDAFADFYDEEICKDKSIKYEIFSKKALILNKYMVGELDNLYHLFCDLELAKNSELVAVSERGIKQAIGALLIHCPVYRYYCTHFPLDKEEAGAISDILKSIGGDDGDRAIVILRQVLLKCPQDGDPAYNARVAKFYMRCMQFSGPLMAKGVEDTVMYTYNRFIAHNEVGDAPSSFGITVDEYHRFMQKRLASWPRAMNATATHDMKRGEDARMRLNVLSDIPALWVQKVKEWQELNKNKKQQGAPDANEEYFIYEALVAAYPMPGQPFDDFTNRFRAYIRKASREAKRHTNWNVANDEYEMSMEHFIDGLLHEDSPFLKSFEDYLHSIADHGILNSLCQQVLKYTSPGVPDTYQGCELWDLSMVDPDNRRPVDYQLTSRLLSNIDLRKTDAHLFVDLWESRYSGKIKLWLVQKMLQLRAEEHMVFATGAYTPLDVKGKYKNDIIAYARQTERVVVVVVLPLHTAAICAEQGCELNNVDWRDTVVTLPEDSSVECVDLITGIRKKTSKIVNVNDLFDMSHFAVLKYDAADNPRGAGILLPMFSVPSPFGIGDFGKGTKEFADFLYRSGQKYWQLLPLNPTEMGTFHSPYSSISSMAGNPLLISPELLAEEGLLDRKELKEYHLPDKSFIDYKKVEKTKYAILDIAWQRFKDGEYRKLEVAFEKYCVEQNAWLDDFALYRVVKDQNNGLPWYEWQDKYKWRDAQTLSTFARERADDIKRVKWLQFIVAINGVKCGIIAGIWV